MKKLPARTENAITNLYTAFHNDELDAFNCSACAVGNICNNNSKWSGWYLSSEGKLENRGEYPKSEYSFSELKQIELVFLTPWIELGIWGDEHGLDKETQFKGLCAVIEYLCELDNVPNVMEIQSLFEYKEGVKELNEVIQ